MGSALAAEPNCWSRCLRELKADLPENDFNTWIRPLQAVETDSSLKLLAPNRFVVDWLNQHYLERMLEIVARLDPVLSLSIEVGSRKAAAPVAAAATLPPGGGPAKDSIQPVSSRLSPGFTFASFVEGKSNQLARAAASQVGENPGQSYNPLFIYGGVGLGKNASDARGR